jgi:hypothetical protein
VVVEVGDRVTDDSVWELVEFTGSLTIVVQALSSRLHRGNRRNS